MTREDAEACLAAIPKAKRFDELAATHEALVPKCRQVEAKWLFGSGQLAESQRTSQVDDITIRGQAATIALQRDELARRWSPWVLVALGAGAVITARVAVGFAVPALGYF